jgi:integrase
MPRRSKPCYDASRNQWILRYQNTRHYLCSGATPEAERLAWTKARQIMDEPTVGRPPRTVAAAVAAWLEANGTSWHRAMLAPFSDWAEGVTLTEIHPEFLGEFLKFLQQTIYSFSTMRRQLRCAHAVLQWSHVRGYLPNPVPPLPKLPALPHYSRAVEPTVMRRVFAELRYPSKHILTFMAATWCRPGEVCGLKFTEIRENRCILRRGKTWKATQRERCFFLNAEARQVIAAQPWRKGYVFRSRLGKPYTVSGLGDIFGRAAQRAGVQMTQYQIRHTGAQDAINRGVPVDVVAIQLGHAPASAATRDYVSFSQARTHDLLESHVSPLVPGLHESAFPAKDASDSPSRKTARRSRRKSAKDRSRRAG